MTFFVAYLLLLTNGHGTFIVGKFGGPDDKNAMDLARINCQAVVQSAPRSATASMVCVPATEENLDRYSGVSSPGRSL